MINHNVFNDLKKLFNIDTKFYFLSQPKDKFIFKLIKQLGYHGPIGAEYKPKGNANLSLGWLKK